jgi:large subunit ribosomal protein L13
VFAPLCAAREIEPSTGEFPDIVGNRANARTERTTERDSRTTHFERESSFPVTRTYSPKASEIKREWLIIDATDVVLGRLASHAAALLRGKHKPTFAPHLDTGDFVIIINADKVALTGSKLDQKKAYRHSGYPGGLTATNYSEMLEKQPTRTVEKAIRGMLPKNSIGRAQLTKLKVYTGSEHPHAAQQPKTYTLDQVAQ